MSEIIEALGPQPDYKAMSDHYQCIAVEMKKIPNTPQVGKVDQIIELLRNQSTMLQQLATTQREQSTMLQQLATTQREQSATQREQSATQREQSATQKEQSKKLDQIIDQQKTRDRNHLARTQNSLLVDSTESLAKFYDLEQGREIPNFPSTPRGITSMSSAGLGDILRALGIADEGTKAEKQQKLREFIGLRSNTGA